MSAIRFYFYFRLHEITEFQFKMFDYAYKINSRVAIRGSFLFFL